VGIQEYQEIWQEICFILSESIKNNINERDFENQVLRILEVLGWREFKGEIERQISIQVGRQGILKPDLVVYDKEKKALIVIEVKRPQEDISRDDSIAQLKSYMRQMKADFGFLVGNEIRIYYDGQLNPQVDPLLLDKIPFIKDEQSGISFAEIFQKKNFISGAYLQVLDKKISKYNAKKESKKLKDALLSEETKQKILEFLEKEFADYNSDIFASVMTQISISLEDNSNEDTIQPPQVLPSHPPRKIIVRPPSSKNSRYVDKTYSISELEKMHLDRDDRPKALIIQNRTIKVSNWTDLSIKFVEWLIESNSLKVSNLPIYSYSERDKYFINSKAQHKIAEKDAQWNTVLDKFHVDTKYNADGHKKNIIHTLKHLGVHNPDIKISF